MEHEPQSDTALMLRVKLGEVAAFSALHERYQRQMLGFFYGLTGSSTAANDLAQETFLRLWQVRKRYRATGPFPAYLFAIARMIWHEQQRRESKQWRLGIPASMEGAEDLPAHNAGPADCAAREELGALLIQALAELPEEQRLVFLLRHVKGLSLPEIAGALDCPVNTVRSRKILAVKKLRQLLAPHLAEDFERVAKES